MDLYISSRNRTEKYLYVGKDQFFSIFINGDLLRKSVHND